MLLLRDLCQAAAIKGGADAFAEATLGESIRDSLKSDRLSAGKRGLTGVLELIPELWNLGDDEPEAIAAMLAVVERWTGM